VARRATFARYCLEAFSWLLAVPVLLTTGLLFLMTGAALAAVMLHDKPWVARGAVLLFGLAGAALAWWGGRRLGDAGWRYAGSGVVVLLNPLYWAFGLLLAAIALEVGWIWGTRDLSVGTADALASVVAWGMRPSWIIAAAAGVASALALAVLPLGRGGGGVGSTRSRGRVAVTGLTSISLASIGLVVANSIIFAAFAPFADKFLGEDPWPKADGIRCLPKAQDWALGACPATTHEAAQPAAWGKLLLQESFAPVPFVIVALLGLLALVLVAMARYAFGYPVRKAQSDDAGRADSRKQGAAYSWGLRILGGKAGAVVMWLAVVGTAAFTAIAWLPVGWSPSLWDSFGVETGAASSLTLAILLGLVRFLGANPDPRTWFGSASGNLEKVRVGLDLPYDIATYLRIGHGRKGVTPRERMLERYRTVLAHVCGGGQDGTRYDGIVFVAHSQGTVLTAATLFGDPSRTPPAEPLLDVWGPGGPRLPGASLALLTFGSPLRQIYVPRFPGQFDRLVAYNFDVSTALGTTGTSPPGDVRWINVYRAGDFIGRSLWSDPTSPDVGDPDRPASPETPAGCEEACIGVGQHTGYWSDPRFLPWVEYAILLSAGANPVRPPFGAGAL
jgi:hypothetical protein